MYETNENLVSLEEDTQKGKFLIFSLGSEAYGIDIKYVTEIIGIQAITAVPELPEYVKGIVNLRGKIIPIIDVRLRFKKDAIEYDDRTCIIVVDIKETSIGLVVDRVSEVINISDENIAAPPDFSKNFHNKYVKGIGKVGSEVKLMLDCDKIIEEDEIKAINSAV